jgi:ATP-dependent RNA circularization protein (DNA/RNA ligase family)
MYRKFDKIYRIEMPDYNIKGKYFLAKKNEELLFKDIVYIFEKVDGANSGIYKDDKGLIYLQKKGSECDLSHPQYSFFMRQWLFNNIDKLKKLPNNIVVYGELLRCVHTIKYDKLPDWFLVFDIYDLKQQKYLIWEEVEKICNECGLKTVPLLFKGKIKKEHIKIPKQSKFGNECEGVVVKSKDFQTRGKYVKPEFVKAVEESVFWRDRKIVLNKVI